MPTKSPTRHHPQHRAKTTSCPYGPRAGFCSEAGICSSFRLSAVGGDPAHHRDVTISPCTIRNTAGSSTSVQREWRGGEVERWREVERDGERWRGGGWGWGPVDRPGGAGERTLYIDVRRTHFPASADRDLPTSYLLAPRSAHKQSFCCLFQRSSAALVDEETL